MAAEARVLVVEDNPITRKLFRVTLASEGYEVLEAGDGRAALELVKETRPDLVLLDLVLPDMDGFELLARLRDLAGMADVPVLAVSGFLRRADAAKAPAAGFTDFLIKPVEPSRLVEAVRIYLPGAAPAVARPGAGRHVIAADDDPVQLRLTRIQLSHLGFRVTTAASGREALARARESRVDGILSDVLMPDLDGFQLCLAVRQGPPLSRIPVVLCSAYYVEDSDRRLAERVGASAMVMRTPDLREASAALLDVMDRGWAPPARGPVERLELERLHRALPQVERLATINVGLLQRASLQGAVLTMLAGLSDTLARHAGVEPLAGEVLASVLDAGGISMGTLLLVGPDRRLRVEARIAPTPAREGEDAFLGHPELFTRALAADGPIIIPSAAVDEDVARDVLARIASPSVVLLPLACRGERLGVLLLATGRGDVSDPDWLNFARTVALEVAQTVALARAFAQLAESERRARSMFDNVPVGLFRTTVGGAIVDANPAAVHLLGSRDRDSLLGTNIRGLYARPDDAERLTELVTRDGLARGFETELRRPDGTSVHVRVSLRAVAEGAETVYEGSIEDITARKEAEARLVQTEKIAALGQLLAGVAHELNNPLAVALGQAALLANDLPPGRARDRTLKIGQATERCARIVKNFLSLARQRPPERRLVRLDDVVREAVELLSYVLRVDNIDVTFDLAPALPALWADPDQLHQVVVNLVVNAHHAMRDAAAPRRLTLTTRFDPAAGRVQLDVADTGPGVPAELQSRIFEPFFTTKPVGQGTGVGLSLCQGIVESHGGTLRLASTSGAGAVFRVELPLATAVATEPGRDDAEPGVATSRQILVVDDEPTVAELLAEMLTDEGHRVDTAENGIAALERLERHAYDVILTDLRMPELDGLGLYREVARRWPELLSRFIFLTGDALSPEISRFLEEARRPSVNKPFVPRDLQRALRELSERSG